MDAASAAGVIGWAWHTGREMGTPGELSSDVAFHWRSSAAPGGGDRPRAGRAESTQFRADADRGGDLCQGWKADHAVDGGGAQSIAGSPAGQDRDGVAAG